MVNLSRITFPREAHETTCCGRSLADNSLCGLTLADLDSMRRARFIERARYFKNHVSNLSSRKCNKASLGCYAVAGQRRAPLVACCEMLLSASSVSFALFDCRMKWMLDNVPEVRHLGDIVRCLFLTMT